MSILKHKTRLLLAAACIVGLASFWFGYRLLSWQDAQVEFYNLGIEAYKAGDPQTALELFDKSLGAYKQREKDVWLDRFLYPAPSREFAAMAHFHKAKSLLRMRKAEPAVDAFKESLKLNPGNNYKSLAGFENTTKSDLDRLFEQSMTVKYDLELLFNKNQQLGGGQGKEGQEQKDGQKGQEKKQAPGNQPGQQPGKGKKDDI